MSAEPAALASALAPEADPAAPGWAAVRETFLAWERLRVVYVLTLGGLCGTLALLCGPGTYADPAFWLDCVVAGLAANVAFFAGPVGESYAGWLGVPRRPVRFALFGAGLAFSALLAAVCVLFHDVPF